MNLELLETVGALESKWYGRSLSLRGNQLQLEHPLKQYRMGAKMLWRIFCSLYAFF